MVAVRLSAGQRALAPVEVMRHTLGATAAADAAAATGTAVAWSEALSLTVDAAEVAVAVVDGSVALGWSVLRLAEAGTGPISLQLRGCAAPLSLMLRAERAEGAHESVASDYKQLLSVRDATSNHRMRVASSPLSVPW